MYRPPLLCPALRALLRIPRPALGLLVRAAINSPCRTATSAVEARCAKSGGRADSLITVTCDQSGHVEG
jgi:hypothetical protein